MTISMANLINLFIIAAGTGICGLTIVQVSSGEWLRKEIKKYFQLFFAVIIVYMLTHLTREMMNGVPGSGVHTALYIVAYTEFFVSGFMAYLLSLLVLTISKPKRPKTVGIVYLCILIAHIVLLTVAQFTDLYYTFDAGNVYHRAPMYILSNIPQMLMMLLDIYLMVRYRKNIKKHIAISLWVYLIAPIVAIIVQSFIADVQFIIIATVCGAAYMFATITRDQVAQYEQQKAESSRIEAELNMASGIQADMLPNIFPAFPERDEFDVFASMTPAKEVGGDFYDFFLVDDEHLALVMADVSGKGVPAALFMMISKILVQNYTMMGKDAAKALEAVNNQICANNREEMFVTVWLGVLDLTTGKLTATNAGHEYPILKQADGDFEPIKERHGFVIGGMEGVKYKAYEMQLQPDSKLFLYTDGVPEATNANDELFGLERTVAALRTAQNESPEAILGAVDKAVADFVKDAPQFDDLTMLCLHYKGKG